MKYKEFQDRSRRPDATQNDMGHFFSSQISTPTAFILHKMGMFPNLITWLFLACGVLSALALSGGNFLASYLLWRLHIVLDMADGTVARATEKFSRSATGFDRSNHIVINILMIFTGHQFLADGGGSYSLAALMIAFFLSYFFSRNYLAEKSYTKNLPISGVIIRNLMGLEGYVLAICVLGFSFEQSLLDRDSWVVVVPWLYASFFFLIYLVKLASFLRQAK